MTSNDSAPRSITEIEDDIKVCLLGHGYVSIDRDVPADVTIDGMVRYRDFLRIGQLFVELHAALAAEHADA